jgi:hypothetical protein
MIHTNVRDVNKKGRVEGGKGGKSLRRWCRGEFYIWNIKFF